MVDVIRRNGDQCQRATFHAGSGLQPSSCLPNVSSACWGTFLLFLAFLGSYPHPPHSLIPSTARLRINYISIDWPLIRGIDIHGPPSAGRCVFHNTRARASCITPGLHYLLYSSWCRVLWRKKGEWYPKKEKKIWLWARCLSRCWSTLRHAQAHPECLNFAKWSLNKKNATVFSPHVYLFNLPYLSIQFFSVTMRQKSVLNYRGKTISQSAGEVALVGGWFELR